MKEDSAVATVWEVLIVAQNQRQIFLLLFWQSAVIVNALSCMICVGGTLLSSSFCIICFRALWLVSRRSKPAFPSIVFINEVSLLTPSTRLELAFTGIFAVIYAEVVRCFDALL